jgi:hypothetical protein
MIAHIHPSDHFQQRFSERFNHKMGFDHRKVEVVSKFSTNRYDHPKVMQFLQQGRAPKYLVSSEHNIVIPVDIRGRMVTALWYHGKPMKN